MNNQNHNPKKVFFADNEEVWKKAIKKDAINVIIRNEGAIDKYKPIKKDRTKTCYVEG